MPFCPIKSTVMLAPQEPAPPEIVPPESEVYPSLIFIAKYKRIHYSKPIKKQLLVKGKSFDKRRINDVFYVIKFMRQHERAGWISTAGREDGMPPTDHFSLNGLIEICDALAEESVGVTKSNILRKLERVIFPV